MAAAPNPAFHPVGKPAGPPDVRPVDMAAVDEHRRRTFESYEAFLRAKLATLDARRTSRWRADFSSQAAYERSVEPMRRRLGRVLGFWTPPESRGPVRADITDVLYDQPDFRAERFVLEVRPGLWSYGIELRPPRGQGNGRALLVQHGYASTPESVCGFAPGSNGGDDAYRSLGLRAVRRGFHVIAVHHPYGFGSTDDCAGALPHLPQHGHTGGKNRLHRLAVLAGGTAFGLDLLTSSRGIDLLLARGFAPARIGAYGLSQGGQSTMFLAALDRRVSAAVCSAYFNTRITKLVGPARSLTYLDSTEEDKFLPEVVSTFADASLVGLIAPRAFAVEAGLADGAADYEQSAQAFAEAAVTYRRLRVARRIEFIAHRAGHVPVTSRAFDFLHQHLSAGSRRPSQRRSR